MENKELLVIEQLSWIREEIVKTGKVAPIDVDRLMKQLLRILNNLLRSKLLDESGLRDLLEQLTEQEKERLEGLYEHKISQEKERLQLELNSKVEQLGRKTSQRIQEAEYAESVMGAFKTLFSFFAEEWEIITG